MYLPNGKRANRTPFCCIKGDSTNLGRKELGFNFTCAITELYDLGHMALSHWPLVFLMYKIRELD